MAIYRCEVKTISRGQGRSVCAAAAYRAGVAIPDERQQMTHDYGRKGGIEHAEILASESAPEWVKDRVQLWNCVDAAEKRKDAMTAREALLTLPRELTADQRRELVQGFVMAELVSKGLVVDVSYHAPDAHDKEPNYHSHLLWSDRAIGPEGLAGTKDRTYARPEGIEALRSAWAEHVNRALEAAGRAERVDHRSLKDQHLAALAAGDEIEAGRVGRPPETKIGPQATAMERCGRKAHAFEEAHAIRLDAHGRNEAARMLREVVAQIAALEAVEAGASRPDRPQDWRKPDRDRPTEWVEPVRSRLHEQMDSPPPRRVDSLVEQKTRPPHHDRQQWISREGWTRDELQADIARGRQRTDDWMIWAGVKKEPQNDTTRNAERAAEKLGATLGRHGSSADQDRGIHAPAPGQRRPEQAGPDFGAGHAAGRGHGSGPERAGHHQSQPAPQASGRSLWSAVRDGVAGLVADFQEMRRVEAAAKEAAETRRREVELEALRARYTIFVEPGRMFRIFDTHSSGWVVGDEIERLKPILADKINAAFEKEKEDMREAADRLIAAEKLKAKIIAEKKTIREWVRDDIILSTSTKYQGGTRWDWKESIAEKEQSRRNGIIKKYADVFDKALSAVRRGLDPTVYTNGGKGKPDEWTH